MKRNGVVMSAALSNPSHRREITVHEVTRVILSHSECISLHDSKETVTYSRWFITVPVCVVLFCFLRST